MLASQLLAGVLAGDEAALPSRKDYPQEYSQAFKGEPADKAAFTLRGNPEGIERIKYEPDGLRITLPPGYLAGNKGVGLIFNYRWPPETRCSGDSMFHAG